MRKYCKDCIHYKSLECDDCFADENVGDTYKGVKMKIIRRIKWLLSNKPMIKYPGCNCGCCGKWIDKEFEVPTWSSGGKWWDTWGICDECLKDAERFSD